MVFRKLQKKIPKSFKKNFLKYLRKVSKTILLKVSRKKILKDSGIVYRKFLKVSRKIQVDYFASITVNFYELIFNFIFFVHAAIFVVSAIGFPIFLNVLSM